MQNVNRNNVFSKYKIQAIDVKSKLLTRSLLWMSLGLTMIILVAYVCSISSSFSDWVINFVIYNNLMFIFSWIFNLAIIFALFWSVQNRNISIFIPLTLYIFFAIYEGMFISTLLLWTTGSGSIIKDLLLYMLIPSFIFGIMGFLGYFNLINFSKLIPFTIFAFFGLFIMSLFMMIFYSQTMEILYFILASAIFTIWIGFDLQMISKTEQYLPDYTDKKEINRISFMFGIKLFIDFINLLMLFIRYFR